MAKTPTHIGIIFTRALPLSTLVYLGIKINATENSRPWARGINKDVCHVQIVWRIHLQWKWQLENDGLQWHGSMEASCDYASGCIKQKLTVHVSTIMVSLPYPCTFTEYTHTVDKQNELDWKHLMPHMMAFSTCDVTTLVALHNLYALVESHSLLFSWSIQVLRKKLWENRAGSNSQKYIIPVQWVQLLFLACMSK